MKKHVLPVVLVSLFIFARPVAAQNVIVRDTNGLTSLQNSCYQVGCTVQYGLDGKVGQTFLVTPTQSSGGGLIGGLLGTVFNLLDFIAKLLLQPGVTNRM